MHQYIHVINIDRTTLEPRPWHDDHKSHSLAGDQKSGASIDSRWSEQFFSSDLHWQNDPLFYDCTMYFRCVRGPFWTGCRPNTHGHRPKAEAFSIISCSTANVNYISILSYVDAYRSDMGRLLTKVETDIGRLSANIRFPRTGSPMLRTLFDPRPDMGRYLSDVSRMVRRLELSVETSGFLFIVWSTTWCYRSVPGIARELWVSGWQPVQNGRQNIASVTSYTLLETLNIKFVAACEHLF